MKRAYQFLLLALAFAGIDPTQAGENLPPPYRPRQEVSGTITIWGHGAYGKSTDFIEGLTLAWESGFANYHPNVKFDNRLHGTASAIGALYTGTGDLALMGREIWPNEVEGFTEVYGYAPTGIDVVTGSFDARNRGYALVAFVHKDNPISRLTLAQLDAAFSVDRLRGGKQVRTWGDLGLGGEWKEKPVHLYGMSIARGFADYFEQAVFAGSRKWNPSIREYSDEKGSKGGATDGGQKMLDAMAHDPLSLGYAGLLYHNGNVKPLALAVDERSGYVMPTRQSVMDHSYPLTRLITMYSNRKPGEKLDPKLDEFYRYILSRDGQQAVLDHGHGYLPILSQQAESQLEKLNP